jgi:hypothetical protein
MSRSDFAWELLKEYGTVTMGLVSDRYPDKVYTFRNAIAELKPKAAAEGYMIEHINGKDWRENGYKLSQVQPLAYYPKGQGQGLFVLGV